MRDLMPLVERFAGAAVVVVGDAMLDNFVYGGVSRISPEAPVPVLLAQHQTSMLGGAGNVASNLAALGAKTVFLSVVGDDQPADELEKLLGKVPACVPFLLRDASRQTPVKTRFVARSHQLLRVDRETVGPLSEASLESLLLRFRSAVADADAVILSDYAKGVLSNGVAARLIDAARQAGKPVIVDPKEHDFRAYAGATLLKPNLKELGLASRMPVDGDEACEAAARHLMDHAEIGALLVTRGPAGMILVDDTGVTKFPSQAREVFDVSGAGDTVAAALAAALAAKGSTRDAVRIANTAAGMVVAKVGTAVVTQQELLRELDRAGAPSDSKVVGLEDAIHRVTTWRHMGFRVGFTNGCFDLLHPGHVALLRQARERCDRLVIGLNTDASVRGLKGPTRPVQNEDARAQVLAALESVDLVTLFPEPTPERLIRDLRPDLLVKGSDYRPDQVVGADLVKSWGGELALIDLVPGHSTTSIIERT